MNNNKIKKPCEICSRMNLKTLNCKSCEGVICLNCYTHDEVLNEIADPEEDFTYQDLNLCQGCKYEATNLYESISCSICSKMKGIMAYYNCNGSHLWCHVKCIREEIMNSNIELISSRAFNRNNSKKKIAFDRISQEIENLDDDYDKEIPSQLRDEIKLNKKRLTKKKFVDYAFKFIWKDANISCDGIIKNSYTNKIIDFTKINILPFNEIVLYFKTKFDSFEDKVFNFNNLAIKYRTFFKKFDHLQNINLEEDSK